MLSGIAGSEGYGVGKIVIINNEAPAYEDINIKENDVTSEIDRFDKAVSTFTERTQAMADSMKKSVGEKNAEILEGHILMISDPFMQDSIKDKIKQGECAEKALDEVCEMFIGMFSGTDDELTMQRATDVKDIRVRMLRILTGSEDLDVSEVPAGTILVARDLTPSMTAGIVPENVEGIITEIGGRTSHSAILARALEIPAVLSVENIVSQVKNGQTAALSGTDGTVILDPDYNTVAEYKARKEQFLADRRRLEAFRGRQTADADGTAVDLYCNIGSPDDLAKVKAGDGEGIGLFRTEFLFMGSSKEPSEDEQFEAYKKAAEAMNGAEVIIRTLDVGGDKAIPYLNMEKEDNPFLGFRAVRYCLDNSSLYRTQLRALLRASAYGNIKIMVPLVTTVTEIREVKRLVEQYKKELDDEGRAYKKDIKVGVMIETPAASIIADLLAKEADFFSIGTNDLTQYTMAVDRGNSKVAYLYSAYDPAVIRSIARIIKSGRDQGIPVGMCGEAAADPLLIPLLMSFGLNEYSVSPNSVLKTRSVISAWTKKEADQLTEKALSLSTRAEVEELLKSSVKQSI